MIRFPQTLEQLQSGGGEIRAGGTDLQERRHRGVSSGPVLDLRDLADRDEVALTDDGGLSIGSGLTVAALAEHPMVRAAYPGLAAAAGGLATPQIRARATVGGNLLQRVRCWYYRNPSFDCLKSGGSACLARAGDHTFHASHDTGGPCIAAHPSTLAVALQAADATVTLRGSDGTELVQTIPELLGDGRNPRRDHAVAVGSYLASVELPPPVAGEQSGYFRAIGRAHAEWPLVEVATRLTLGPDGRVASARVVMGAVTNRPLDATAAEAELVGRPPTEAVFLAAGALAVPKLDLLPGSGWKAQLIPGAVCEGLLRASLGRPAQLLVAAPPASTPAPGVTP